MRKAGELGFVKCLAVPASLRWQGMGFVSTMLGL